MGQTTPMKTYSSRILEKALSPTIRAVDVLGFTMPPMVAAYYWLVGEPMPEDIGQAIGLWVLGGGAAFVFLRLVSAPYFVWREDQERIAELVMEVGAPLRIEMTKLAEIRAEARAEMADNISSMNLTSERARKGNDSARKRLSALLDRNDGLTGRLNACRIFDEAYTHYALLSLDRAEANDDGNNAERLELGNALLAYLHGGLTSEGLRSRLPPDIVEKIRP